MQKHPVSSEIRSYCAQVWIWCESNSRENLTNPELFDGFDLPDQPDAETAKRALREAEKLLYRLRFQVDEKLAIRSFAVNTACGE